MATDAEGVMLTTFGEFEDVIKHVVGCIDACIR